MVSIRQFLVASIRRKSFFFVFFKFSNSSLTLRDHSYETKHIFIFILTHFPITRKKFPCVYFSVWLVIRRRAWRWPAAKTLLNCSRNGQSRSSSCWARWSTSWATPPNGWAPAWRSVWSGRWCNGTRTCGRLGPVDCLNPTKAFFKKTKNSLGNSGRSRSFYSASSPPPPPIFF